MMDDCVDYYQQQMSTSGAAATWLADLQKEARQEFKRVGFPTRHHEDWKYTSVDAFLKHRFVAHMPSEAEVVHPLVIPISSLLLPVVNGELKTIPPLPHGVVILPILEALAIMPEKVKPYLGQILTSQHAFHALNTAMFQHGLFIYIPENVCLEKPLWLRHWQDQVNQSVNVRHVVVLESGSQVTLIEDYAGSDATCYFTNTMSEIHLAPKAILKHYKIQRESKQAFHVGHLAVRQAASSQFDSHSISIGGQWVRSDITIHFDEPNACCLMNGIYVPGEGQHMDHHTIVHHAVPDCQSVQDYKGILKGKSRAVFNGRVIVAKDAQHSDAKQQNKNLLLSAQAEIDTKPQLEIFANDVVCTHGATVGQLDEEALFYCATRGIDPVEASRYLMNAFMIENMKLLENEQLATWIGVLLNDQLG